MKHIVNCWNNKDIMMRKSIKSSNRSLTINRKPSWIMKISNNFRMGSKTKIMSKKMVILIVIGMKDRMKNMMDMTQRGNNIHLKIVFNKLGSMIRTTIWLNLILKKNKKKCKTMKIHLFSQALLNNINSNISNNNQMASHKSLIRE